jgi:hypothetical protein
LTEVGGGHALEQQLDRHWLRWAMLAWAGIAAFYLWQRWPQIYWLSLSDTDDNMRLMQVRGLLGGQGWYDLRQYRLNPPAGLDIHWSRLVDLPIAALIVILRPFVGTGMAERLACGIAPMLPLAVTIAAMGFTVRRLVAPTAWPVALIVLLGCTATMSMFLPMRIDHHGWQLACLSATVAGLADPRRARGGAVVGFSSAVSLTIGLELLPYCAMAGAIVALRWIWERDEAERLQVYALSLAGGSAIGFALFASNANQGLRCDALTPVWLSVMVAAGALLFVLARINPRSRVARLALAGIAGAAIVGGFAGLFPQCLGRPEQVSDELATTWLNNVREAKPIYSQPLRTAFPMAVLPVIGVIGAVFGAWHARGTARFAGWPPIALFTAFAGLMLLWQVRAGPAAQLLSVPGATVLAWVIVPLCLAHRSVLVRVFGSVAAFLVVSGLFAGFVIKYLPIDKPNKRTQVVNRASGRCGSLPTMRALDRLPAAVMFTHVDLGPRLIVTTHHSGITGPYHRNEQAILDVHHAFTGPADRFRAIAKAHGATYLLTCPNIAESTVYRSRNPNGFYGMLAKERAPGWLIPVALPKGSPLKLWRIDYAVK